MNPKKAKIVTIEYEDGTKTIIKDMFAVLFQARVNTAGVMSDIEVEEEKKEDNNEQKEKKEAI